MYVIFSRAETGSWVPSDAFMVTAANVSVTPVLWVLAFFLPSALMSLHATALAVFSSASNPPLARRCSPVRWRSAAKRRRGRRNVSFHGRPVAALERGHRRGFRAASQPLPLPTLECVSSIPPQQHPPSPRRQRVLEGSSSSLPRCSSSGSGLTGAESGCCRNPVATATIAGKRHFLSSLVS